MKKEFKTKLDISNNRFFKQSINQSTNFDGINHFGVELEKRRLGPNKQSRTIEVIDYNIDSPFTYNIETGVMEVVFGNPLMNVQLDADKLDIYSEVPNFVTTEYIGIEPYTVDGVIFYEKYEAYEYEIVSVVNYELNNIVYGEFKTAELYKVIADTLDYKGDNTVVYVNGKLKAEEIIAPQNFLTLSINDSTQISTKNGNYFILNNGGSITLDSYIEGYYFYVVSEVDFEVRVNDTLFRIITPTAEITMIVLAGNNIYIK